MLIYIDNYDCYINTNNIGIITGVKEILVRNYPNKWGFCLYLNTPIKFGSDVLKDIDCLYIVYDDKIKVDNLHNLILKSMNFKEEEEIINKLDDIDKKVSRKRRIFVKK